MYIITLRMQIEKLILSERTRMLFVEYDSSFEETSYLAHTLLGMSFFMFLYK